MRSGYIGSNIAVMLHDPIDMCAWSKITILRITNHDDVGGAPSRVWARFQYDSVRVCSRVEFELIITKGGWHPCRPCPVGRHKSVENWKSSTNDSCVVTGLIENTKLNCWNNIYTRVANRIFDQDIRSFLNYFKVEAIFFFHNHIWISIKTDNY